MDKPHQEEPTFQGFEQSNTTPVPDILFDELLSKLSGAELKVMLYIIRRTRGFKKDSDAISLSQFQNGIITREGKVLDRGCGIKRRQTIIDTLASLEKRGYIVSQKGKTSQGDDATTVYQIRFKVVSKPDYPSQEGSFKTGLPVVSKPDHGSFKNGLRVVSESDPQETVIQQTALQKTVIQENSDPNETTAPTLVANATPSHSSQSPLSYEEEMKPKEKPHSKRKQRDTEPLTPKGPPKPPPDEMPWGTKKCLMMFDAWRGKNLIGYYNLSQASTCAKEMAIQYTEEEVRRVYKQMNEDEYWIERGGADICNVARQIHKELKRIKTQKVGKQSIHGTASHDGYTKDERLALMRMSDEERRMYNQKRREAREKGQEVPNV